VRGGLIDQRLECTVDLSLHRIGRPVAAAILRVLRRVALVDELRKKRVREELFKVIEYQMRKDSPKETKQTFDRLRAAGYSRKETMRLLAFALLVEMNEMVKDRRTYNEAIYVKKLKALPEMAWSDEPEDCT